MNTTTHQAKQLVVIALVITAAISGTRSLGEKEIPQLRVWLGVVIAGVFLAAMAEVAPKLAAGFAALMIATATIVFGGDAWKAITTATKEEAPAKAAGE